MHDDRTPTRRAQSQPRQLDQQGYGDVTANASAMPLAVSGAPLPPGSLGQDYVGRLTDTEPTRTAHWSVTGGALPPGLVLAPNGWVLGTPSAAGVFRVTVLVSVGEAARRPGVPTTGTTTTGLQQAAATFSMVVQARSRAGGSASLAAAGGTGSIGGTPGSAATSAPPLRLAVQDHWAGYEIGGGPYTEASGTFTVPDLLATDIPTEGFVAWVGIDGTTGASLIQAGVQEIPDPDDPGHFVVDPWWEILPAPLTRVPSLTVIPGDPVTVTITRLQSTNWQISLQNDSTGQQFLTDQGYSGPGASVEWIVEAPVNFGLQTLLAPFTPSVDFSGLGALGPHGAITKEVMEQEGSVVASPSPLTDTGFAVTAALAP